MMSKPHRGDGERALRVGIVVDSFPVLSQTFVIDQVAALAEAGVNLHVYARQFDEDGLRHASARELLEKASFAERASLVRLASSGWGPGRYRQRVRERGLRRFYRGAARRNDLLLCHFGPVALNLLHDIGNAAEAAPIWTVFHGYDLSAEIRKHGAGVYAPLFEAGGMFLPISRFWAARLVELGCPAERIHVLRMGVDCRGIAFAPSPHVEGEPFAILSVGRLVEKKGTGFALQALGELKARSPELDWRFDVVGEGPFAAELKAAAEELGIGDRVKFLGGQSAEKVRELLSSAHIFLLPSVTAADGDMEGIPVALMEAMAAGVPVVSTDHSGIPELVEDGISGLLAPEGNAAALATHLRALMTDGSLRDRLARAARAKVEAEFDEESIAQDFVEFIEAKVRSRD